jgi:hypothetical protein
MKTAVTLTYLDSRQRITNMEKLAPGFAELTEAELSLIRSAATSDKIVLVLAPDQRTFSDWCRQQQAHAGPRLRRVRGSRDLQGYAPDSVKIVELPDWHLSMSYDEHQRVEQMLEGAFGKTARDPFSGTMPRTPAKSPSLPTVTRSRIIMHEFHSCGSSCNGTIRVRIGRTKERKGMIDGDPLDVVTTQYLDGKALRVASTRKYFQEDEVAFDAVPARTKDITDFGRLTTAAKSLAVSMAPFGPDNEPSSEQLAVFINGYRNLLEWRRKVREQMTRAEGEIDAVETLLTQIL